MIDELPAMDVVAPTATFREQLVLDGVELRSDGGGHTASDAFLWLPEERVLFAGDLVVVGNHPSLRHGDPAEWRRILGELEALEPAAVVPGHGPVGAAAEVALLALHIADLERLARWPGEHEAPRAYAAWRMRELFAENLEVLRRRAAA